MQKKPDPKPRHPSVNQLLVLFNINKQRTVLKAYNANIGTQYHIPNIYLMTTVIFAISIE